MSIQLRTGTRIDAANCDWWIISNYSDNLLYAATTEAAIGLGLREIAEYPELHDVPSVQWCSVLDFRGGGEPNRLSVEQFSEYMANMS